MPGLPMGPLHLRFPGIARHSRQRILIPRPNSLSTLGRYMRFPLSVVFPPAVLLIMLVVTLAMRPAGALQTAPAHAQQPVSTSSPGEVLQYDEKEAQRIDRMLMCPVCPAETIDQAQVEYSKQMRRVVREMLAQGHSRHEILDFFADRYGPQVLAAPPKSGLNLLAWIVPVVAVFVVIAGGLLVIRSMAKRDDAATGEELPAEEGLEEYLAIVDEETSG